MDHGTYLRQYVHQVVDQADPAKLQAILTRLEDDSFAPEEIKRIDALLLEGLESRPSREMTAADWAELHENIRQQAKTSKHA